ncbi:MAG: MFS transporter, partial [Oscillospiraceae bacterium]|nr:MFS transporter [Oscillospiraceae bacterium]
LGGTVSVSIAIKRVFASHGTLALGICSAGTGAATIICPPIATAIISAYSLRHAFWAEGAFLHVATIISFFLIGPKVNQRPPELKQSDIKAPRSKNERKSFLIICAASFLIGTMGNTGWNHLSVLYTTEGLDPISVSRLISFIGLALTAGKILYGEFADRMGGRKTALCFCSVLIIGEICACFAGKLIMPIALLSMLCMGLGLPISTVGFSSMAADLSTPAHYPSSMRSFQLLYMVGTFVTGSIPGIIADKVGSYVPFYYVLSFFAIVTLALVFWAYRIPKEEKDNA